MSFRDDRSQTKLSARNKGGRFPLTWGNGRPFEMAWIPNQLRPFLLMFTKLPQALLDIRIVHSYFVTPHRKEIVKLVQQEYGRFVSLLAVEKPASDELRSSIRRHLIRIAILRARADLYMRLLSIPWMVVTIVTLVVIVVGFPGWVTNWLNINQVPLTAAYPLCCVGSFIAFLVAIGPWSFSLRKSGFFSFTSSKDSEFSPTEFIPKGAEIGYFGSLIILLSYLFLIPFLASTSIVDVVKYPAVAGMLSLIVWLLFGFGFVFLPMFGYLPIYVISAILLRRSFPATLLVSHLLSLLDMADLNSEKWADTTFKRKLLERIEIAASIVQVNLPRTLRSGDKVTDTWFQQRTERMAFAIRDLKKWVLLPRADTREYFMRQIALLLIPVVRGDWFNLPQAEIEDLPPHPSRLSGVYSAMTTFLKASPALIWLAFQQSRSALQGPLVDTITLLAFSLLLLIATDMLGINRSALIEAQDLLKK